MAIKKRKQQQTGSDIFNEYRSVFEIADILDTIPAENHSRSYDEQYFCPFSFDDTLYALRHGWREGTCEIHAITEKIQTDSRLALDGYAIEYDVTGDFLDMGAYLEGTPECMGSIIPRHIIKDSITIVVNASASFRVSEKIIRTRGAAITALIERLQDEYDVNLVVGINIDAIPNDGRAMEISWQIDLQNEFSRDLVAFAVAHPGFLRRVFFALVEVAAGAKNCSPYGHVRELKKTLKALNGARHYYFPAANYDDAYWEQTETATKKVVEIMQSIQKNN